MSNQVKQFIFWLIVGLIWRFFVSVQIYSGDLNNHWQWGVGIIKYGFAGAYDREYPGVMKPTYPPLPLFAFTSSTGVFLSIEKASTWANDNFSYFPSKIIWWLEDQDVPMAFQKTVGIFADLGIAVLIVLLTRKIWVGMIYLLLPPVWYLSSAWGQIESFPIFFVLLSWWLLKKQKLKLSHVSMAFALISKQTSILFLPWHFILSVKNFGWKKSLMGLLIQMLVIYVSYLPFMPQPDLFYPVKIYVNRLQTGSGSDYVTDHAFNPWYWLIGDAKISDKSISFYSVSANHWGVFFFGIWSISVLSLLWFKKTKNTNISTNSLSAALLVMGAFLLMTKMHERYLAPAIPFLLIAASQNKKIWITAIFVAIFHQLNIFHIWWWPDIPALKSFVLYPSLIEVFIGILVAFSVATFFIYAQENHHR